MATTRAASARRGQRLALIAEIALAVAACAGAAASTGLVGRLILPDAEFRDLSGSSAVPACGSPLAPS
jgi:hypothetical protein